MHRDNAGKHLQVVGVGNKRDHMPPLNKAAIVTPGTLKSKKKFSASEKDNDAMCMKKSSNDADEDDDGNCESTMPEGSTPDRDALEIKMEFRESKPIGRDMNETPGDCVIQNNTERHVSKMGSMKKRIEGLEVGSSESGYIGHVESFHEDSRETRRSLPRKFTSPAGTKRSASTGRKAGAAERDPSPIGGGKRSASPVPSKCVVPSLVAAREENRKVAREAAIIVPSRYRQPSPSRTARAYPNARRASFSPATKLSGGIKVSLAMKDSAGRKITSPMVTLGGQTARRRPDPLRNQVAMASHGGEGNGQQLDEELASGSSGRTKSRSSAENFPNSDRPPVSGLGFPVREKKWSDIISVCLDSVSADLAKLGKEAVQRRALAASIAAESVEEAISMESFIRSLCMFAELSSSSKPENPLPVIDGFLSIYDDVARHFAVGSLIELSKSASLWVEAALVTDLEIVSFLNDESNESLSSASSSFLREVVRKQAQTAGAMDARCQAASGAAPGPGEWASQHGRKRTAVLARKLQLEMQMWFVQFMEESLDAGFQVLGENGEGRDEDLPRSSTSIAAILSQLKRVNDWLDQAVSTGSELLVAETDKLKRKIYDFVIHDVGTTPENS